MRVFLCPTFTEQLSLKLLNALKLNYTLLWVSPRQKHSKSLQFKWEDILGADYISYRNNSFKINLFYQNMYFHKQLDLQKIVHLCRQLDISWKENKWSLNT